MSEPAALTPLGKTRLHQEIVEQLKDAIIRGDFQPGSRLPTERELAERLNVNRTTVREAIQKLEGLGLVEIKHGAGLFVKDYRDSASLELARLVMFVDGRLNFDVLKNLMGLRLLLVPEISYHAARNRTEEDLKKLEQVVFDRPDLSLAEKDLRIHNLIARMSGNLLFLIMLNSFTDLAARFTNLYFLSPKNQKRSEKFHREIYEAIKHKKPAAARKIMKDVLVYAEKQTLQAIEAVGAK